jgi:4-hydroxy-tetrahydrodipicolinate synthase
LAQNDLVVETKESTDDIRRVTDVFEFLPNPSPCLPASTMTAHECCVAGVAGLVDAFPKAAVEICKLVLARLLGEGRAIYRWFLTLLDLDVSTFLVQNIKFSDAYAIRE